MILSPYQDGFTHTGAFTAFLHSPDKVNARLLYRMNTNWLWWLINDVRYNLKVCKSAGWKLISYRCCCTLGQQVMFDRIMLPFFI